MIPDFDQNGNLPPGRHQADWDELVTRYGWNARRRDLLLGLREALKNLAAAGCSLVYINGSFVTTKDQPDDYDGCWDVQGVDVPSLDPVFLDLTNFRQTQKDKYGGEFFPAQMPEASSGLTFLEFFQLRKYTLIPKGIVTLDPRRIV